ncbi:MAG: delta-lactam-biosynthetic de-N-acetylase [Cellulosilyticaceae bacterium]
MKKHLSILSIAIMLILNFSITTNVFATPTNTNYQSDTALNNTKVDWWLVREKDHQTPRFNDKLNFDINSYDAYCLGSSDSKNIYLTFDEGYENGYTSTILDILKKTGVKAVFFVTSPYIDSNEDLIKRMVNEGHIVANHTKRHKSMPSLTSDPESFKTELSDVANKYKSLIGHDMPLLFRPPMGQYSQKSLAMTQSLGYKTIFWSFAYKDFDVNDQPSPDTAKQLILNNLHDNAILLLHAVSKTNTVILEEVITKAKEMGYTFSLLE